MSARSKQLQQDHHSALRYGALGCATRNAGWRRGRKRIAPVVFNESRPGRRSITICDSKTSLRKAVLQITQSFHPQVRPNERNGHRVGGRPLSGW